jgi:hypothetical protein
MNGKKERHNEEETIFVFFNILTVIVFIWHSHILQTLSCVNYHIGNRPQFGEVSLTSWKPN